MSVTKFDAVVSLVGNTVSVSCVDPENTNTFFYQNGSAPSDADIKAKQAELKTAYDNAKYQRDRASEYPSIADQLDDLYHNGIDGWKATIKTTKDKYPK